MTGIIVYVNCIVDLVRLCLLITIVLVFCYFFVRFRFLVVYSSPPHRPSSTVSLKKSLWWLIQRSFFMKCNIFMWYIYIYIYISLYISLPISSSCLQRFRKTWCFAKQVTVVKHERCCKWFGKSWNYFFCTCLFLFRMLFGLARFILTFWSDWVRAGVCFIWNLHDDAFGTATFVWSILFVKTQNFV